MEKCKGIQSLRRPLLSYLQRGCILVDFFRYLVTNGSHQGIDFDSSMFFPGPSDIVITEEATYSGAIDIFHSRGAVVATRSNG